MMQIPGWRKDEKFTYLPLYGRQRGFERFADLPDLLHLYALFPTGKINCGSRDPCLLVGIFSITFF